MGKERNMDRGKNNKIETRKLEKKKDRSSKIHAYGKKAEFMAKIGLKEKYEKEDQMGNK